MLMKRILAKNGCILVYHISLCTCRSLVLWLVETTNCPNILTQLATWIKLYNYLLMALQEFSPRI